MKVRIDTNLCSGCALCQDIAPEVFGLDEDNMATVLFEEVPEEHEDAVREAAEQCPSEAVEIIED